MASVEVVAKRYSKALFELAGSTEVARSWIAPLDAVVDAVNTSPELANLLRSPAFSAENKWAVLSKLGEHVGAPKPFADYLRLLAEAQRTEALEAISADFKRSVLEAENSVEANVQTAIALSDAQTRQMQSLLEKAFGKKVTMIVISDSDLVAGLRVSIGGKTLDATLSSNLDLMNKELLGAHA